MINYEQALAKIKNYCHLDDIAFEKYAIHITNVFEYPFGWLFIIKGEASPEIIAEIGDFEYTFSIPWPQFVSKFDGEVQAMNYYYTPPFVIYTPLKAYAKSKNYEWKPEWEVEFDKNATYLKFE